MGSATRVGDTDGESAARARVQAAKTALGERGPAWWEQTDDQRRARWTEGLHHAEQEGFGSASRATDVEGDGS
jgi:hypothetical protein